MKYNYHTHTYHCNHAYGKMENYVKNAIKQGIKELGFSDHSPYFFDGSYYSNFRMKPDEAEKYVNEVTELREKYKDKIKIYIGYEMEWYPKHFDDALEFIKRDTCDYLILAVHHTNGEIYDGIWSTTPTCEEKHIYDYTNCILNGIETGKFTYIAHPDIINFRGERKIYDKYMTEICKMAKEKDIPLEINALGLRENRNYPGKRFFELAKEIGNKFVIGIDAHEENAFTNYHFAKEFADSLGLKIEENVKLVRP